MATNTYLTMTIGHCANDKLTEIVPGNKLVSTGCALKEKTWRAQLCKNFLLQ